MRFGRAFQLCFSVGSLGYWFLYVVPAIVTGGTLGVFQIVLAVWATCNVFGVNEQVHG